MNAPYSIRPATLNDATPIAEAQVASWHSSYKGIVPQGLIERMTVEERAPAWGRILMSLEESGLGTVYVCERDGDVVGFASMGVQREPELEGKGFSAEVTALYLIDDVKRQGIGTALVAACAQAAQDRGHSAMSVWVLDKNEAGRAFYEALGGQFQAERLSEDRNAPVDEVAYGWSDLSDLLPKAAN